MRKMDAMQLGSRSAVFFWIPDQVSPPSWLTAILRSGWPPHLRLLSITAPPPTSTICTSLTRLMFFPPALVMQQPGAGSPSRQFAPPSSLNRSEEHTSELQSLRHL